MASVETIRKKGDYSNPLTLIIKDISLLQYNGLAYTIQNSDTVSVTVIGDIALITTNNGEDIAIGTDLDCFEDLEEKPIPPKKISPSIFDRGGGNF
ncbi:hypothetical protein KW795_00995 [Candidatus Microgenomates bacterium]|nr:hypothetical protein [Candidatus Microgenomates bacterium]